MEFEEVKDSVKDWFNNRLKNPYFSSVLAIWLITNRVLVFGLLNFGEDQTLDERVSWIHQQLLNKRVWVFHGFDGIILYSFLGGFVAMIAFNYLNVLGKIVYNGVGRGAINLQRKLEPSKWVPFKDLEELKKENENLESSLDRKKSEIIALKKEKESALINISSLRDENTSLKGRTRGVESNNFKKLQKDYIDIVEKYEKLQADSLQNSSSDYENKNKLDREFEAETFFRSEAVNYFDIIFNSIEYQKPITDVPNNFLDEYLKKELISIENGFYVLTPKGKRFYMAYMKRDSSLA